MKYCILLLVVATALGVPIIQDAEDVQCNSLFQFRKEYVFTYTGTTETGIIGTHEVTSDTRITCQDVIVSVPERCIVVLNLRRCTITPETPETTAFTQLLERYELMGRVHNGLIIELLPHVSESMEVLNVKKGILSALQMEWTGSVEEELVSHQLSVHGNCSTTTTHVATNDEYSEEFLVTRDLSSCSQKPFKTPLLWSGLSFVQNMSIGSNLLNSSQQCQYEAYDVNGLNMQRAQCTEIHSFWPLSFSNDRGIMTKITQVLEYRELVKLNSLDYDAIRYEKRSTSIIQEIPKFETSEELSVDEAMSYIIDLVKSTLDEVKMETPRKFGYWVKALRSLNNDTIHDVFERTYNCKDYSEKCANTVGKPELAREYLWDGLIQCGTVPCFSVVNTAIIKDIIPKPLAHVMMYTMAFRDYPTLDIITEGVRIAQVKRTRSMFMPLSTMIHKYWLDHPEIHSERELPVAIRDFMELLNNIINNDCTLRSDPKTIEAVEEEHQILLAIKALGNLGPVAQKYDEEEFRKRLHFERELLKCTANNKVSFNISLSAVQALRRFNMSTVSNSVITSLKETFLNASNDVEIRIAAYLIYMKADLTAAQLVDVYVTLREEPVKQFKAFTFSHIRNVLESEDPSVQRLRKELTLAIGETEFPEYPKNILKYSRNMEISKILTIPYFNKTFGGSIESNIIFNPNALMPKSMMLKYAVNAMGKEWELIESGLDIQGFEAILESIFGPAGFFPNNMMQSMLSGADELIMSKVRNASSPLNWLASLMDLIMSRTPVKDLQAASNKALSDTKDSASNLLKSMTKVSEPEPEPEYESVLDSNIQDQLDEMHDIINKQQKERIATIYLRILGNELGYLSLDDIKSLIPVLDRKMITDMVQEIGSKLEEGVDLNTTRSILFLERELVLPTGLGMPLNCLANGSVVASVRTRGQLSINLPSATISGRLAPSAGIEILGTMGVHVPTTKVHTGVMANASVYHSSNIEGNVTIDGPRMKVQLKALDKPVNLLNFSVNYFLLKPNGEMSFIPGIMENAVRYEQCANPGKILGASLCMSFAYPNASYVEIAPRFPLTGPLSFNITLNNTDQTLGAYTFEAEYRKIVKGGAKPKKTPTKKTFGKIGSKTNTYVPPDEVIDIITVNFTAPGDSIRRDIMTVLSYHRNKTEAKWSFDIPEMEGLKIFAGLLNLNDVATGETGMHLVWNATYREKDASVSFTMKNSSMVGKRNYTAVFNASVEKLHFATVMQHIKTDTFMITSMNETFYWDDETPIYEQLTWPTSGYSINPLKYCTSVALIKSLSEGPQTDTTLFISSLGQNLTVESLALSSAESYSNEITSKFENSFVDLPLLDLSYQHDIAVRMGVEEIYRYVDVHRGDYSIFYQKDVERELETNTVSRNYTFGAKGVQQVLKEGFAELPQDILDKYDASEIHDIKPVNLNTTFHFYFNNETIITPSYFAALNVTASIPKRLDLTDQTRWGLGFTTRFMEEQTTPEQTMGYVLQLNNTIPFLLLDFTNEIRLRNTTAEGLKVSFSHQTLERKYGKHVNIDMFNLIDVTNMALKNGLNFTSPYYNYSGGFSTVVDDIHGLVIKNQMGQNGFIIPTITDYLTDYYLTLKLWQNSSIGFHLTHKLINVSTDHLLHVDGPVTNFSLSAVPFFLRDLLNKTYHSEFEAIKTALLEVSYNITNSSLTIGNDLFIKSPYILNVTMDHDFFLDVNRVNHSLILLTKSPLANLDIQHSLVGPDQSSVYLVNTLVTGNVAELSSLSATVTGKAKYGKSLNSNLVLNSMLKTPKIANITMGGSFIIKGMKNYQKFDEIELALDQEVNSVLGYSYLMGTAKFDTFKRLTKFSKSEVGMQGIIQSRFLNFTSVSGIEASGFNDILEFDRLNTSTMVNVTSPLMSFSFNSSSEVTSADIPDAWNVKTSNKYHLDSLIGNANYNFGYDISNISSPLDFHKMNGTSDFNLMSRMMNATTSYKLDSFGFRNLLNFDKVNGSMIWNVTSVLGNGLMSHKFELNNFQNLTTFDSATVDMMYGVRSKYLGEAQLIENYGVFGTNGLLVFDEANATADASITSRFVNTSLTYFGKIKKMKGLLQSNTMLGKVNYETVSRFFNMSGSMLSSVKGMNGLFKFKNVINNLIHESVTPYTRMTMDIASKWISGNGFMNHELATNNFLFNFTTPVANMSSNVTHISGNSQSLFAFDQLSLLMENVLTSKILNMSSGGSVVGTGFESLVRFSEFKVTSEGELKLMTVMNNTAAMVLSITNMNGLAFDSFITTMNASSALPGLTAMIMEETSMTNLRNMFDFDSVTSRGLLKMENRYINLTSGVLSEMLGSRKFLDFDSLSFGSRSNISLPIVVFNNSIGYEIIGMKRLTEVDKIGAGVTTSLKSKLLSVDSAAGYELIGQTALFTFNKIHMGANASLLTPVVNMSAAVGSEMIDSKELFNYTSFRLGGDASLNSTIVTMKSEGGFEVFNQTSLFTVSKISLGAMSSVTNKVANLTMGTALEVLNHDKFLHFELFSHNASMSLVSSPESMKHEYQVTMKNSTGLFRSELFEVTVDGTNSGLFNSSNKMRYAVSGNAGFGVYDTLELSNVMDMKTKYLNGTSTNVFSIVAAKGLLTFEKGTGTSASVVSTPFGEVEIIGSANMDDFRGFMNFTNMALRGKLEAGKLLNGATGADFVNFEGPFVFERMNATTSLKTINPVVNYTGDVVMEVLNGAGLFRVSKALLTTSHNVTNSLLNQTVMLHLEANDVHNLTSFSRAFLTGSEKMSSLFVNGSSLIHLEANNVESLMTFAEANATVAWDLKTPLMTTTSDSALLITNCRSLFDVDLITILTKTDVLSNPANVTTSLSYALMGTTGFMKFDKAQMSGNITAKTLVGNMESISDMNIVNMDGLVKLDKMDVNTLTTVSGPLGSMQLSGDVKLRKMLNVTTFKLLNGQYELIVFSSPLNVTSNGLFNVEASRNIFDVSLIEGNMIHNISTPYTSTNISSALLLREMTSFNSFDEMNLMSDIKMRTPLTVNSMALSVAGDSSWQKVTETLNTSMVTPQGSVEIAQLLDYENAKVSVTVPSYGYVHLHGHLNEFGDEMTIKMKHILEGEADLVEDFRLFVKLNKSDVIYTNFSWNPEVIADLMDISTDALNRTINFTMTLVNQTKDNLEKVRAFSVEKLVEFNETLNSIIQNPRLFLRKYVNVSKYDEIRDELITMIEFARENPKEALQNVYDVMKASAEQAANITVVTYGKLDEKYMLQEKIDRLNRTIQDIIFYITYPKETWELVKPKLEEVLTTVKETINYDLIKTKFNEIVDVPKLNLTIRKQLKEINRENLMMLLNEMKLLINTTKVTEAIDALKSVEVNVGCVTFKDLAEVDMEAINNTYIKIKELLMLDNLKQFINISQVELLTTQINQTLMENLNLEVWNNTIHAYVDIPLLNETMIELLDYIKEEINTTLEDLRERVNLEMLKMKIRYEELKVVVKDAIQLFNDTLVEVSGMNWVELKEKVNELALQLNETVYEKIETAKIMEILEELKQNVTSRINMTKIDLAVERLTVTLQGILDVTKNETHPINILPVKYFEVTVFEFVNTTVRDLVNKTLVVALNASDVYGETAFELSKKYGQKTVELYNEYSVKALELYNHYSNITIEKGLVLYKNATVLYDIYSVKLNELMKNVSEIAVNKTEEWQVVIMDYIEKANQTVINMYEEYYPVVSEFVANNTEKGLIIFRNISAVLVEKSEPYVVKAVDLLTRYKNDLLLQSSDVCINVTTFIEDTIERLPEYQELMLNLTEKYTELGKELGQELIKNVTIYANVTLNITKENLVLLNEWRLETMSQIIEITKNEENLLNYYPVEWTGKTVNVLTQEIVEKLNATMLDLLEKVNSTTREALDQLKIILADETHSINKYPVELLGKTVFSIFEDVKQNVTDLVEQGKVYIEVAREFVNNSIVTFNETLIEYNITRERLNDTVIQVVTLLNETLTNLTNWIEVARDQPLNVTIEQIVDFANKTALQALDLGNQTLMITVDMANKTLNLSIELWNNLTRQENLDKIPIYVENVVTFLNNTLIQVNETIQDTILLSKKFIIFLKEETEVVQRLEEYKDKVEELRVNVTRYLESTRDTTLEILVLTKDTLLTRSTEYIEYLNNTLPGWMYRYYKVDALPYQLWNYTSVKGTETFLELSNTTKVFVQEFVSRFVHFSMDSNSLTVNFSHPFNWTTFRSLPTLTDAQLEALVLTKDEIVTRLILPSKYQIERLTELIKVRYEELMVYITTQIEENRPIIEERLTELRQKIKETREQIELMRAEFNWTEFKENITTKYQEAKDYVQETYPIIIAEIKENVTRAINETRENYPLYIAKAKEIAQTIMEQLKQYQEEFPETVAALLDQISDFTKDLYLPTDLPPLIKPWTYTGMIFGTEHVMTFDGHVYKFPAYRDNECTYVLARDFIDGNFTLLVKNLSTTLVLDSCTVTVDNHGLFFINGNPIPHSPPYVSPEGDVIVTRDGPWINVTTTYGIDLNCHDDHYMCIYKLSGWYYSKTQGLLGNLDTEHFNELLKPDGTIAPTLIDFANSYEVSGLGVCQIPLDEVTPEDPSCFTADKNTLKAECEALFNQETSYLSPIFDIINPEPFLLACKENAEKCRPTLDMVNPYINLGRLEGIVVTIPGCVTGANCTFARPAVTTADVVFIISERWTMTQGISCGELKENLKTLGKSFPDTSNFALVSYGGPESYHCKPHLGSSGVEPMGPSHENLLRVLDTIGCCSSQDHCPCASSKGDALKAIAYATELNMRADAFKTFVLIDSDNTKEYTEDERLDAADSLINNTITFNVISSYSQYEKTIGKVPIIGVKSNGGVLYNKRNSEETTTEILDTPKGAFAKLATATDGYMIHYEYVKDESRVGDVAQVMKKQFGGQRRRYSSKDIVCFSVRDIYGRASSRCAEI